MCKRKLFMFLFGGLSIMRILINIYFPACFLLRRVWLLYLLHCLIILRTFLMYYPTVSIFSTLTLVEYIMLGDGTVTQEIFDKRKYQDITLIYSAEDGNAYSLNTGEMMYTKYIVKKNNNGENTILSLVLFTIFYTLIGFYVYYIVNQIFIGNFHVRPQLESLIYKAQTLNVLSVRYPVVNNLKYILVSILTLLSRILELLKILLRFIF